MKSPSKISRCIYGAVSATLLLAATLSAQEKNPYAAFPSAKPPYYRVQYKASDKKGELIFAANYTIWIPPKVKTLRGVVVHQHGCGVGSCRSGLTGAFDLHWQALAKKHDCALLSPTYEQPQGANCQMWCDPRNGSDAAFRQCLVDLGKMSGHPELPTVPWALWGHSGGGHWCGGMVMLHPTRIAAAWLRSGVPLLKPNPKRPTIQPHTLPRAALRVPIMCNLGTREGVTKGGRFAQVWPANEVFFQHLRKKNARIGVAIDPLTAHECGNSRYLAIPWLDVCLKMRLPKKQGRPLRDIPATGTYLSEVKGKQVMPLSGNESQQSKFSWLPNKRIALAWQEYVRDTKVGDNTPPPRPHQVSVKGNAITWQAAADVESGLSHFIIQRDGKFLARVPEQGKNRFGRPIFQNLQYSDTPTQPLVPMRFVDKTAVPGKKHRYRVITVNTVGLQSPAGD